MAQFATIFVTPQRQSINHKMRAAIHTLIIALSVSLAFAVTAANHISPQNSNQQRPRTVGQSNSNNSQNANKGEEVDEGDVVRVETQQIGRAHVGTPLTRG